MSTVVMRELPVAAGPAVEGDLPRTGIVMPLARQRGGAEAALLQYLSGVSPALRGSIHLCFLEDGPLAVFTESQGFPTVVISAGRMRQPLHWARCVRGIARWLRANRLQIVLSWMSKAHLYAGPAALAARVPAVWWQHGLPRNRGLELLATLLPARRVLSCSNAAAAAQRKMWPQRSEVRTIYPPVDLRRSSAAPARDQARVRLGLPARDLVVGIVARLQRWKGVHVFLEAASELLEEREDLCFVVVGGQHPFEAAYASEVKRRARELGLESHLRFVGHQANPDAWIAAMDIVVNASFGEPFGMTIVEAMALGKPVVATSQAGPLEIVTDGVDGLLVAPGDALQLSAAVRRLAADAQLRCRLGAAARVRAERYAVPRFVAEVNQSLREVAGR